jgi:hypothetical protein
VSIKTEKIIAGAKKTIDFVTRSKSGGNAALAKELLDLLQKKREIENEMADAVHNLRKAYSSMYRDLESVLCAKLTSTQLNGPGTY